MAAGARKNVCLQKAVLERCDETLGIIDDFTLNQLLILSHRYLKQFAMNDYVPTAGPAGWNVDSLAIYASFCIAETHLLRVVKQLTLRVVRLIATFRWL